MLKLKKEERKRQTDGAREDGNERHSAKYLVDVVMKTSEGRPVSPAARCLACTAAFADKQKNTLSRSNKCAVSLPGRGVRDQ